MGKAGFEARREIEEIRLSAPNKHHYLVELAPCGLGNDGEVLHADGQPYGLIECTVARDDASDPGLAGPQRQRSI